MGKIDLVGQVYGSLTVVSEEPQVGYRRFYSCLCSCGKTKKVAMTHLRTGHTQSCGCLWVENPPRLIHGENRKGKRSRLYKVWNQMIGRCFNPHSTNYASYGGKGVTVCKEWQDAKSFVDWANSNGYQEGLTIDRKDAYGHYEPSNCRWIPISEQGVNRRIVTKNVSGYDGVSRRRGKWAARITVGGKRVDIGTFSTPEEANTARLSYITTHNLTEHRITYENQQRNRQITGSEDQITS